MQLSYFKKSKTLYAPGAWVTHLADKVLELTAKEILSEVDDSSAEEDEACIHDIMTALPRTTTGDTDHGKAFVVQVCKLGAEVEKRTEVCCRKPSHLIHNCEIFKKVQELLNIKED